MALQGPASHHQVQVHVCHSKIGILKKDTEFLENILFLLGHAQANANSMLNVVYHDVEG